MRIEALTLPQVRHIYRERMTEDFPPDELKPLGAIERGLRAQAYLCYGATQAADVLAYAFFVRLEHLALFDYFAVRKDLRGRGIGSRVLKQLTNETLKDFDCVLLEVDDPEAAQTPEEKRIRANRYRFYLRNGLLDTSVVATVWGVDYRILALTFGSIPSADAVRAHYAALYRSIMTPVTYAEKVFIHHP